MFYSLHCSSVGLFIKTHPQTWLGLQGQLEGRSCGFSWSLDVLVRLASLFISFTFGSGLLLFPPTTRRHPVKVISKRWEGCWAITSLLSFSLVAFVGDGQLLPGQQFTWGQFECSETEQREGSLVRKWLPGVLYILQPSSFLQKEKETPPSRFFPLTQF